MMNLKRIRKKEKDDPKARKLVIILGVCIVVLIVVLFSMANDLQNNQIKGKQKCIDNNYDSGYFNENNEKIYCCNIDEFQHSECFETNYSFQ